MRQGTTHTKDMRSKRDDATDAGQKRLIEYRPLEEEGGGGGSDVEEGQEGADGELGEGEHVRADSGLAE